MKGPLAGLFAGGNYQLNGLVLGVEGDWQWSNLTGSNQRLRTLGSTGAFPAGPMIFDDGEGLPSVRGRLGFALTAFWRSVPPDGPWAIPLTSYALVGGAPLVNQGGRATGWTARVLASITPSLKASLRASNIATEFATAGFVSDVTNSAAGSNRVPIGDLRAGIAYKFGGRSDTIQF